MYHICFLQKVNKIQSINPQKIEIPFIVFPIFKKEQTTETTIFNMNPKSEFQDYRVPSIKTITFGELVKMVIIPKFQRPENEAHCKDILNFELKHKKDRGHFLFPNSSVIILGRSQNSQKMSVLDGQHRLSVIVKLIELNQKYEDEKQHVIIMYGNDEYFHDTYNRINSNMKADIILSKVTSEVINQFILLFKKNFKDFISSSKKPHRPNINIESFLKAIKDSKIVEILGIVDEKDLYAKITELNDFYSCFSKVDFKNCGIPFDESKIEKHGKKLYLGLWNNDFEFLARVIQKFRDNVPYLDQDHSLWSKQIKKIEDSLAKRKTEVECECCNKILDNEEGAEESDWCWKKSLYIGGEIKDKNVAFVCKDCIEKIGGKHGFNQYMRQLLENIPPSKTEKITSDTSLKIYG
jgi:hypothetical protein